MADFPDDDDVLVPIDDDDSSLIAQAAASDAAATQAALGRRAAPPVAVPMPDPRDIGPRDWATLAAALPVTGAAAELAANSEWLSGTEHDIHLRVAIQSLSEGGAPERLRTVLSEHFGRVVRLDIEWGSTGQDTAYALDQSARKARQQAAEQAVPDDAQVQAMTQIFGARLIPGSVRPPAV